MDDEQTVPIPIDTVSTSRAAASSPSPYHGPTPLQSSLFFGTLGAVGGPLGILAGLALGGLGAAFQRSSITSRALEMRRRLDSEYDSTANNIAGEQKIADPDEARMLQLAKTMVNAGYERLRAGDPSGQELMDKGNAMVQGIVQGDITRRKSDEASNAAMNQQLISSSARSLRDEYQGNITAFDSSTEAANKLLRLTAQKDFDPNKPFYKAALTGLLADSVNSFYKDSPSVVGELTAGVGGALGAAPNMYAQGASAAVTALGAIINAKDAEVSREDYNRIAMNVLTVARETTTARMQRLSQQGQNLEAYGKKNNVFAPDFSLSDYITGGVSDLPVLPIAKYIPPTSPKTPPATKKPGGMWNNLNPSDLTPWKTQPGQRPTN